MNANLLQIIEEGNNHKIIDVLVLVKPKTTLSEFKFPSLKILYHSNNIYAIQCSVDDIKKLSQINNIVRIEYTQHRPELMSDTAHIRNRIKNIKTGLSPLSQPYDGAGIIIGIIDSGTDFNHPDFKDINGKSRINYLWDMRKPFSSNTPQPFGYGQEWDSTQIDLGQCTHDDLASYGHGTNSTGIAAGNGYSVNKYEGMAPKANIVVVALDFNRPGNTIADAVQYLISKSIILNKPLVINASVGDYYGSHDGTDLETQIINGLVSNIPGRAMIAACGNGGSSKFHVGYNVSSTDTNFTWIKNNSNTFSFTEYADTAQIKNVKYAIGVNNNSYNFLGSTPFKNYNDALNTTKKDTIYHNNQRIGIVYTSSSINNFGVYELLVTIKSDSLNYLWSVHHTGNGRIDSWSFDYVSSNLPLVNQYPTISKYILPDTIQSIVSGFQCSDEIIAVGNYIDRNKFINVNNVLQVLPDTPGQLHASSSTGPTRDNRIKPDITATGANILTCMPISMLPTYVANFPSVVAQGGYHRTAGGTSAASPVVAGFSALYFQRHPTATNQQLKNAIINCAYSDDYTGTNLPNNKWGYGKLDGFSSITCGEILENVKVESTINPVKIYPNPFSEKTNILFPQAEFRKIKLFNYSGQVIMEDVCYKNAYVLNKSNLTAGVYFVLIDENGIFYKIKIVIL